MYMEKRILCFGDSNTWGYDGERGGRFPSTVRWTGLLSKKLTGKFTVIEEGMNGRTTAFSDYIEPGVNAIEYIYPCLVSHNPLDYMIIMLGTNDTKDRYHVGVYEIGYGLDELLLKTRETLARKGMEVKILLIAPPRIYPSLEWIEFSELSARKAEELGEIYKGIAESHNCDFLDVKDFIGRDCICSDGIHLNEKGHEFMANKLFEYFNK